MPRSLLTRREIEPIRCEFNGLRAEAAAGFREI
jgi:hypothetical protein